MTGVRTGVIVALTMLLAGCGDSAGGDSAPVAISDPWIRPTAPGADTAAFYATIDNAGQSEQRLVGASSPRCSTAEVHMTMMEGDVMSMMPAEPADLTVPVDGRLQLEPGGMHVMCLGLTEPVAEGQSVELTLEFADTDPVTVQAAAEQR